VAKANGLRTSPRKLGLVADLIRGKNAPEALNALTYCERRIAVAVKKALQSAIANAENNHEMDVDLLYVKEVFVGKAMVLKRLHTRGRGRSAKIEKPFSNLTVIVAQRPDFMLS
jgi:large subunit ribosomal protein L22